MKKLLLFAMLCLASLTASSQSIFNELKRLRNEAEAIKNDTTKNLETRKIACFKSDALYYLIDKASQDSTFTEYELGTQANAMIEFVNLFVKRLSGEKRKNEKNIVIANFKNATITNPLFNDTDKEVIYGYVDNDKFLTQFSLDTDWVKALELVGGK